MTQRHPSLLPLRAHARAKHAFRSKDEYEADLDKIQLGLLKFQHRIRRSGKKLIVLLEGNDAAGKGGVIQRLTEHLEPRWIRVHPIGKPNVVEQGQHYLERFFARLPEPGSIAIFDRSWYGRVLVERVEKLCPPEASRRAYEEINAFEKALQADGIPILKYVLDVTYDEQKRRFKERESDPFKSWKLTDEDWRNRSKWNAYHSAFKALLRRTSTPGCPWKVIAADSKWSARVEVLGDIEARANRVLSSDG